MPLAGLAAALCLSFVAAEPAAALELVTTIDLDYTYTQDNLGGDVYAQTQLQPEIRDQAYDLAHLGLRLPRRGARRSPGHLVHEPGQHLAGWRRPWSWRPRGPRPTRRSSTKGSSNATDVFTKRRRPPTYSSNLSGTLEMTPRCLAGGEAQVPAQARLPSLDHGHHDHHPGVLLRKDISALRLEYYLKREDVDEIVPDRHRAAATPSGRARRPTRRSSGAGRNSRSPTRSRKTTRKSWSRTSFRATLEDYTQQFKTRLKNSLLSPPG